MKPDKTENSRHNRNRAEASSPATGQALEPIATQTETAPEAATAPKTEPSELAGNQTDAAQSAQEPNQEALAKQYWERLLRTTADFDNFKKRATRERQEAVKYANEGFLQKLIPVLDNLEMALAAAHNAQDNSLQAFRTGVELIHQQLKGALAELGLAEIDATNQAFDPTWHEAVAQRETADTPEGRVLQQMRKGYKLRDRLLRPAMVVVAKSPPQQSPAS